MQWYTTLNVARKKKIFLTGHVLTRRIAAPHKLPDAQRTSGSLREIVILCCSRDEVECSFDTVGAIHCAVHRLYPEVLPGRDTSEFARNIEYEIIIAFLFFCAQWLLVRVGVLNAPSMQKFPSCGNTRQFLRGTLSRIDHRSDTHILGMYGSSPV